ncbi:lactonase family protein [Nocardia sp. NPDC052566]|uniref:lactonase family protein n=1 Tax=Nocardia sp. NPDC052566 TaxID=3364330 RepID=UPI0037C8C31B
MEVSATSAAGRSVVAHIFSEFEENRFHTAYVTNSESNSVSAFGIGDRGALSVVQDPVVGCGDDPRAIVAAPDGRTVYVSDTGANHISAYRVGTGGTLSCLGTQIPTGGDDPFGLAVAPDGRWLYVADIASNAVSVFTLRPDGIPAMPKVYASGATSPRGIAVHPDGRFVYVSHGRPMPDTEPGRLTVLAVQQDGSLRLLSRKPIEIGLSGAMIAIPRNGRFLYVGAQRSDEIHGFRIESDGTLTPVPHSPFRAPGFPEGVAATPDGRFVYAAGQKDGAGGIHGFAVDRYGSLTPVPHSPFKPGTSQVGIAITSDGRHLYTSGDDSTPTAESSIYGFAIDQSGALHEVPHSPLATGGDAPAFQSVAII